MSTEKRKRRWGDRRDGRWVRDVPGLQTIMSHILPNRTDCEVFMKDSFDVTELIPYIAAKNASHPEYKTTVFHALIMCVARMVYERPKMNRFIQGRRMYERYEISLGFVCKRRFRGLACGLFSGEFLLRGAELFLHGLQLRAQGADRFFGLLDGQAQRSQLLLQPFAGLGSEEPLQLLEAIGQRHGGTSATGRSHKF